MLLLFSDQKSAATGGQSNRVTRLIIPHETAHLLTDLNPLLVSDAKACKAALALWGCQRVKLVDLRREHPALLQDFRIISGSFFGIGSGK